MNFWTGLILGLIIGWLIEWLIDWLFWRRDAATAVDEADLEQRLALTQTDETDLQARLAAAEADYQARLATVEQDWQARLNVNEQQWHAQFANIEEENRDLREQLVALAAGTALGAAAVAEREEAVEEVVLVTEVIETAEENSLYAVDGMDDDMAERLRLAGIDSVDDLARADPERLAVALGVDEEEAESWIGRGQAALLGAGLLVGAAAEADEDEDVSELVIVDEADTRVVEELVYEPVLQDDLTRIRGIGPKYAATLAAGGISSFAALAGATPDQVRAIINPTPRQQLDFDSWIAQAAAFAALGEETVGDDLTRLEGIGPVYAARLRDNGINSFAALATSDEATLAGIIDAPAWRRINYADWIAQARLAAAGDDTGLKSLQDQLFRREGDNLELLSGVGNRTAAALRAAGLVTFADLAAASPEQLEDIVRGAGIRGSHDYSAWITEAALRSSGKRITRNRPRPTYVVSCPQDLSAVDGVGPVFEQRLYDAGIGSYWELAETGEEDLATILDLRPFQDVDLAAMKASAMRLAIQSNALGRAWDGAPPDDFDALEGLGEVYERRLYEADICTYEALASTTPERLAEICKAPPMNTPDYSAWIAKAAELAAAKRSG